METAQRRLDPVLDPSNVSSPKGPILFHQPSGHLPNDHFSPVPRYLLRAFDEEEVGRTNESVVASMKSFGSHGPSQVDILARPVEPAATMLSRHRMDCFGGDEFDSRDNLMTWSSSLLFVIQYTIWRCQRRGVDPAGARILAVDTPVPDRPVRPRHGAGARLPRRPRPARRRPEHLRHSASTCRRAPCGTRAARASQLVRAGLYDLYAELEAKLDWFPRPWPWKWTQRIDELRAAWSVEQATPARDIPPTLRMARLFESTTRWTSHWCWGALEPESSAGTFRSFRQSITSNRASQAQSQTDRFTPDEVQRYVEVIETTSFRAGG